MNLAPRVVLVMPDQWPRALLRAELIERGLDAVGAETLDAALLCKPDDPERGPVRVLLVDQHALDAGAEHMLDLISSRLGRPRRVLLSSPVLGEPTGEWDAIITRPATVGEIATQLEQLCTQNR